MSQNKHPIARIKVINDCLSKGGYWTKMELIDKISEIDIIISARTLDSDIQLMKGCAQLKYYAPIEYSRIHRGYHYTDSNYSVDKLPLNDSDIKALEIAATTLKQYQYIPIMKEFTTTIDKIIRVVNRAKRTDHAAILEFIEFEKTPVAEGLQFIDTIIDAIQSKFALEITYQKFGYQPSPSQIIEPYFLKEYRNRWYVVSFNSTKGEMRTYGLDRIRHIQMTSLSYTKNEFFDISNYFGHCIGVNMMNGIIEKIILHFSVNEGHYIKTQPLHKSQRVVSDNHNGLVLQYDLIINYELISIILGFGAEVKVIKPKALEETIYKISKRTMDQYIDIS
jgi:predicted DNA-binding transcriptional regulator YafY